MWQPQLLKISTNNEKNATCGPFSIKPPFRLVVQKICGKDCVNIVLV